ncbi:hypothetical protein DBR47_22385 [Paucibacter sp. KBW04]|nr:hypothetical protein DBR47_22385 [Paucibacter sp. KBW04]
MDGEAVRCSQSLHIVCEASPRGYVIQCHLCAQGLLCDVVPPSSIAHAIGERIKTDRRDAMLLARFARSGDLSVVRVRIRPTSLCATWCVPARMPCSSSAAGAAD